MRGFEEAAIALIRAKKRMWRWGNAEIANARAVISGVFGEGSSRGAETSFFAEYRSEWQGALFALATGLFEAFAAALRLLSTRAERVAEIRLMAIGRGELAIGIASVAAVLCATTADGAVGFDVQLDRVIGSSWRRTQSCAGRARCATPLLCSTAVMHAHVCAP